MASSISFSAHQSGQPTLPLRRQQLKLRVLVLAPTPFFGDRGCHVRIYEQVRGLAKVGIESQIVTYPTGRDLSDVTIARAWKLPGIRASALGPSASRPVLDLGVLLTAWRVVRSFRPHVIHAHLHEGIAIGLVLRKIFRIPLVADLQGSLTEELVDHGALARRGAGIRVVRGIENWLVQRPDHVLTSSFHGVSLLKAQGVSQDKIEPLSDGVDLEWFRPQPVDLRLRDRLGLTGKRAIVFLGVLTNYQGVDLLLDVVPLVAKRNPNVHFLIMGYPNEERYRTEVRKRGLTRLVTVPGRIPYHEASKWLCLGELAVSPKRSLTEANGKLLNYMACGLPVVASDSPVNRELLGEYGVYAAINDVEAFSDRIHGVLASRDELKMRGDALRERAESMFAWPVVINRLSNIYRRVLDGC